MKTIESKGEFATRMQRSPACITKWIKLGKISAAALVGEGNSARIWVERAKADLSASLDPSQQAIQVAPIDACAPAPPPIVESALAPPPPANPGLGSVASERERDLARRARADADAAELDAEAKRRKLALDEGRYVVAEDAAAIWGRELSKFIGEAETFIGTSLSRDIAERHNLDWKTLASQMREAWRAFRANYSEDARAHRKSLEGE
ncbi:hypothetical protein [Methylocystis sp.]|uniref:hypothetical protein n=1 Tax=Methylocystis sp. TaxID=1911079 RepID=UPI003D0F9C5C